LPYDVRFGSTWCGCRVRLGVLASAGFLLVRNGASDNCVGRAGLGAEGFCMADKVTIPLRVPRQLLAQTYEPARRGVLNRSAYTRRAAAMAAAKQVAAA
jgi:hypothetical protein